MTRPLVRLMITFVLGIGTLCMTGGAIAQERNMDMTVQDCIDRALTQNLNLHAQKLDLDISHLTITQEKAAFDPTLSMSVSRGESNSPNYIEYIPVSTIEQKSSNANLTLNQRLATGTYWDMGFYNTLSESNIEKNKNYTSWLGFSVRQSLLKGFGREIHRSGIYVAELESVAAVYDLEEQALDLVGQAVTTYWNLVYARQTLHIYELSRAQADSLYAYNKKAMELGVKTESDVLEARSALLQRDQDILDQRAAIRDIEDRLKKILNIAEEDNVRIVPLDDLAQSVITIDVPRLFNEALENRPDYKRALIRIEEQERYITVAENNTKPDLSLSATYRLNSSGESYGDNVESLSDHDTYNWEVGLSLALPIRNRDAKAQLAKRRIERNRSDIMIDDLKDQIMTDLRIAARAVESNREKIEVAALAVEVNELKLRMEEERYRNHLSTSYIVLEYQTDLANARNSYKRALVDYTNAVTELKRTQGTLLRDYDINIISGNPIQ